MKKILQWICDNILFLIVLFLLGFIPLYPKKPLLDIVNTWVYIRAEDFVVLSVLLVWISLLVRKKINLKTPLTMPILLFWVVGVISTIHGILFIFPDLANVFPNLALLSMVRRVEYLSLFFVAFAAMKDRKRALPLVATVLTLTLLGVALYGIGQKYLDFPAYLTMNEEFAKGAPIHLSALSRIPSTFAGHYDLAAYLVLVLPILASLVFGLRNWFIKLFLLATMAAGIVVLFWTVSRVSFFVLFLALAGVLLFHKKRWVIFSLPIVGILLAFVFLNFSSSLSDRYGNTVKEIDVLVDAHTGEALGNIKEVTPSADFQGKIVKLRTFRQRGDLDASQHSEDTSAQASPSSKEDLHSLMNLSAANLYLATGSGVVPYLALPPKSVQLIQPNASTGENLPQGTGYANLALSPVKMRLNEFFYQQKSEAEVVNAPEMQMFTGDFLIKKASAYDLSLTTRYQGEWPNAIAAFKRNIFLGSGYSSISLAIDNNYLRILGEVGSFGMISFLLIFLIAGIYMVRVLPNVDSPIVKSFVVGLFAGVIGLALNATLIDVFEASKVAFYLWLLMGIAIGVLHTYQTRPFTFYDELRRIATSTHASIIYLGIVCLVMFFPMISNFFVGDDFTWLRWAATSHGLESVTQYFTQADGFFYRPGTKAFFLLMYSVFWLNPVAYHAASLLLHFIVVALVFLLAKKIFTSKKLAIIAAFLFAILSGYSEAIFWISSIGHIFSVMFILLSLLLFIQWEEKRRIGYFIASLLSVAVSLLFHELGAVTPLLMLLYHYSLSDRKESRSVWFSTAFHSARTILFLFSPVVVYLLVRFFAHSHWSGGDYSYNLLKLPFNIVGNTIGYLMLSLLGPMSLSIYESMRNLLKDHLGFAAVGIFLLGAGFVLVYSMIRRMSKEDRKLIIFGIGFMIISSLPFLGLGNIASRYDYLVSFGLVILLTLFIKKTYFYLISSGRDVVISVMTVLLGIFFLLNIIQVQQLHGDWKGAGDKVNKLFISIEGLYSNEWSTGPIDLYFVNVPIRNGDAWVFPVGLEDALWFTFENPKIHVHQMQSVESALSLVTDPMSQKVFVFDDDGQVTERKKPRVE